MFRPPARGYAPYGDPDNGMSDLGFTGKGMNIVNGTTAGLYDFPFREYQPTAGRWLSPDPAGLAAVNPADPQTWNRYAYVENMPLAGSDPLGLDGNGCNAGGTNPDGPVNCYVHDSSWAPSAPTGLWPLSGDALNAYNQYVLDVTKAETPAGGDNWAQIQAALAQEDGIVIDFSETTAFDSRIGQVADSGWVPFAFHLVPFADGTYAAPGWVFGPPPIVLPGDSATAGWAT